MKKNIIFFSCAVFVCGLLNVFSAPLPIFVSDEAGYVSVAAFFAGADWSDAASAGPYYSFGYPLLLTPLFLIFNEPLSFFYAAAVLNSLAYVAAFNIIFLTLKKIAPTVEPVFSLAAAFISVAVSGVFIRPGLLMAESFLLAFTALSYYLFFLITENTDCKKNKKNNLKILLFSLVNFYCYILHQKNIAMIVASFILMILMFAGKKISRENLLIFFLSCAALFIAHLPVKALVKEKVFGGSLMYDKNDFGHVGQLVKYLFSREGIIGAAKNVAGQIFYFGLATFLFGYSGVVKLIFQRGKNIYFSLYILLNFVGIIALGSIFLLPNFRPDHLIYGRYMENIICLLFPIGIFAVAKGEIKKIFFGEIFIFTILSIMVALWFYQKFELNVVSNINVIAYSFFNKYLSEKGPVLFAACVVLALSLLNYLLFRRGKKIAYALIFFYLLFTQYCADAGKNPLSRYLAERRSVLNAARDEKIPAYFYAQQRLNLQQDQFALFKSRLKYVPTVFTDPREKIQEKNHFLISAAISPTILENYELLDFFEDKFYLVPAEKSAPSLRIGAYKAYSFSKKVLAPRDKNFDAPVSVNEKQDYYGLRVTFLKGSYNIKINYETTRKSPRSRVKLTVAECDAREIPVFELARYYLEEAELAKDFFDFDLEFDKNVLFFRLDLESDGETEIKISSIEIAHKIAIKK